MLKKTILLAMAVMAVAVSAAPAASATWTHEGVAITEDSEEGFHGTAEVLSAPINGGVHCPSPTVTLFLRMTAGTTDGHFEVEADATQECTVSGAIAELCGERSLTNSFLAAPGTATIVTNGAGQSVIKLGEIELITEFGTCLTLELTGEITATPNNSAAIGSLGLSGELESAFGPVEVDGTLPATHPGTYGIDAI